MGSLGIGVGWGVGGEGREERDEEWREGTGERSKLDADVKGCVM